MTLPRLAGAVDGAVIEHAEIGGGHDGQAELVVTLRFASGGRSRVVLDTTAGMRLMHNCGVDHAAALVGHPWNRILEEQRPCSI